MIRIHILGGGTPTPTKERFGSAFAVEIGDDVLMFDCGPAATHKLVKSGLWPTEVSHLFFTHHHFDHDVDFPCLLLCRWDQGAGREDPLKVYGPPPTRRFAESLIGENGAFAHDWKARVHSPLSQRVYVNRGGVLPRRPPTVEAVDIEPGFVLDDRSWIVRAGYARHVQPYLDSLAYRVETTSGSVVFTGDTEPCQEVADLAAGADLLLCMCWDHQATMDANGESRGQCGTTGAATMAQQAGVRRLALVHSGPVISRSDERARVLESVGGAFSGEILFPEELEAIEL